MLNSILFSTLFYIKIHYYINMIKRINTILIVVTIYTLFTIILSVLYNNIYVSAKEVNDLMYFKTYFSNNDIIGSLKIKGTNINTLLVKGVDNKYYLNHSIYKEEDIKGSIFVDYRTNLNSTQINIYGHNSKKYNLMFKELEKYKDKEFYNEHKVIEIWDGINIYKYKIFSIQIVRKDSYHMNINLVNKESYIKKLNKSIYDTGENASVNDKILILQTCNYKPKNTYILIIAKLII